MTVTPANACSSCGAVLGGPFCSNCGTAAGPRVCGHCQAALSAHARFCHQCGSPTRETRVPEAPGAARERRAWLVAGITIAILLGALLASVWSGARRPTVPDMANAGAAGGTGAGTTSGVPTGRAPDISQMSPKERFARLNDRVMEAAARGDSATVMNFMPMALGAYAQLDSIDIDSRYHAAVLNMQVSNFAAALALADTIQAEAAGNLFVPLIRGTVAQLRHDSAAMRRNQAQFLAHYDAEIAKNRAEYLDHRPALDDFRRAALQRR